MNMYLLLAASAIFLVLIQTCDAKAQATKCVDIDPLCSKYAEVCQMNNKRPRRSNGGKDKQHGGHDRDCDSSEEGQHGHRSHENGQGCKEITGQFIETVQTFCPLTCNLCPPQQPGRHRRSIEQHLIPNLSPSLSII